MHGIALVWFSLVSSSFVDLVYVFDWVLMEMIGILKAYFQDSSRRTQVSYVMLRNIVPSDKLIYLVLI